MDCPALCEVFFKNLTMPYILNGPQKKTLHRQKK